MSLGLSNSQKRFFILVLSDIEDALLTVCKRAKSFKELDEVVDRGILKQLDFIFALKKELQ